MGLFVYWLYWVCLAEIGEIAAGKAHIVLIVADDQDVRMYGMQPMRHTNTLIRDRGVTFANMFVTSPICCVSRSSILTGQYAHNTMVTNNSLSGNCYGSEWRRTSEKHTIATHLKFKAQYITFYAGKYLNEYGKRKNGQIPPGWDWWNGLIGNSRYYNYSLITNESVEWHGNSANDYLTSVIGQRAVSFLDKMATSNQPLFLMLCPPAPHSPWTSQSKYVTRFGRKKAPRKEDFGYHCPDKHWLVASQRHLSQKTIRFIDLVYRRRWQTLLSLDDLVATIVRKLKQKHLLNNTYIIYTSDNGYHLGQFRLPIDKRQPYEFDVRVPLLIKGPNIPKGKTVPNIALNIDIFPTIADLAETPVSADSVDGISLLPFLTHQHTINYSQRNQFLIEYWGEYDIGLKGYCRQRIHDPGVAQCQALVDCACQDAKNNTYYCLRHLRSQRDNYIYCQFKDNLHFEEFYDINHDNLQMKNEAQKLSVVARKHLQQQLQTLIKCSGAKACSQIYQ